MKTVVVNTDDITRAWYIVDAKNKIVGRLASHLAKALTGKGKRAYSPNQDHGDYIIVINSDNVRLSGKKERPFKKQMALDSRKVILHAVHGMVPKTKLGRAIIKKLHIYKGDAHPHVAQKPQPLSW